MEKDITQSLASLEDSREPHPEQGDTGDRNESDPDWDLHLMLGGRSRTDKIGVGGWVRTIQWV